MSWCVDGVTLQSRFILGTALYPNLEILQKAIEASGAEMVTVSLKRQSLGGEQNAFWETLQNLNVRVLPNTAGCHSVKEVMTTAQMAREVFGTHWIKLELIGDDYLLQPDVIGLLEAARALVAEGFCVWPYCTDDLVVCERLLEAGCSVLMPWAAPIGSGRGVNNPYALEVLRKRLPEATLIVDAGLGAPSQAAHVMEMGFDAVLLNSAVALSGQPVGMAGAFRDAIAAGRAAFESGLMPQRDMASPSTPLVDKPFWHGVDNT